MTQIISNNGGGGGGGGGTSYIAGCGISIENNEISVDTSVVAEKSDLSGYQTVSCMVCDLTGADNDHYPSAKAVSDALQCAGAGDMLKSVYDPNNCAADAFNFNNFYNIPEKTFYLESTSDLTNAQDAYDWFVSGKAGFVKFTTGNAKENLYIPYSIPAETTGDTLIAFTSNYLSQKNNNSDSQIRFPLLRIYATDGVVNRILASEGLIGLKSLATGVNYATPYTPEYDGSPATKKYVDDKVADLMAMGKFLSLWDSTTGQPISFPLSTPYTYHTGDYYIVETVSSATPPVNYRPNGSSYTGTASSTAETDEVEVGDFYVYDGTVWLLATNHGKSVSFANLAGSPYDNANLTTALNAKQKLLSSANAGTNISIEEGPVVQKTATGSNTISTTGAAQLVSVTIDGKAEQTGTPTPSTPIDIVSNNGALKRRNPSGIPLSYTELEYIGGTGTQWIDTGIVPTLGFKVETKIALTDVSGNNGILGEAWAAQSPLLIGMGNGALRWHLATGSGIDVPSTEATAINTKFSVEAANGYIKINDALYTGTPLSSFSTTNHLRLFSIGSYYNNTRMYSVSIWDNDTELFNGIPARRNSDGVIGMYDQVSQTFFTNAGTGTFTAGNTVSSIVADGTAETVSNGTNTATAKMLLGIGDYIDTQEILSGAITRNVGIKVLDGTENWTEISSEAPYVISIPDMLGPSSDDGNTVWTMNTHFIVVARNPSWSQYSNLCSTNTGNKNVQFRYQDNQSTLADFKQFLADQYNAGTPVIIVYPLATPTTESVSGQTLTASDTITLTAETSNPSGTVVYIEEEGEMIISSTLTDNCQLANGCGYTTCTGTLVPSNIACINGCCLTCGGNICIQSGGITNDTTCTTSTVTGIWAGTEAEYGCIGTKSGTVLYFTF